MNDRKVAVVTGASRGIGRAIALDLAGAGYDIVGISRTLESTSKKPGLLELKSDIDAKNSIFLPLEFDISDISNHEIIVAKVIDEFGRIDLLVNNAGIAPEKRSDILQTTPESFDKILAVNLRGTFFLTQSVSKNMLENMHLIEGYHPKIIFITSISADVSSISRAEYCISKSGLSMAAKVFADRLAESGINAYEIRPGLIETDMTAPVKKKYDVKIEEGLIPQNRWGQPEDISKAVVSIANGHFDYATGMIFEISGGMNIRQL